ncbi:MAG: hypothetical protein ACI8YD_003760, partial [Rheinheimera aquimaris]
MGQRLIHRCISLVIGFTAANFSDLYTRKPSDNLLIYLVEFKRLKSPFRGFQKTSQYQVIHYLGSLIIS